MLLSNNIARIQDPTPPFEIQNANTPRATAIGKSTEAKIMQFLSNNFRSFGTKMGARTPVMTWISCAMQTKMNEVRRAFIAGKEGSRTRRPWVSAASQM